MGLKFKLNFSQVSRPELEESFDLRILGFAFDLIDEFGKEDLDDGVIVFVEREMVFFFGLYKLLKVNLRLL